MKLSDFLLFPEEKTVSHNGLEMVTFANTAVTDADTEDYLRALVAADSVNEVRMVLTQLWNDAMVGELDMNVGRFGDVLDTEEIGVSGDNATG